MLDRASRRHSHIVRRQRDQKDGDFLAFKSPLACLFRFLVPPAKPTECFLAKVTAKILYTSKPPNNRVM